MSNDHTFITPFLNSPHDNIYYMVANSQSMLLYTYVDDVDRNVCSVNIAADGSDFCGSPTDSGTAPFRVSSCYHYCQITFLDYFCVPLTMTLADNTGCGQTE